MHLKKLVARMTRAKMFVEGTVRSGLQSRVNRRGKLFDRFPR